ncbi:MAG: flavin reductase family protein [Oscillospiraceae bacterium]|nr:flavin reductase family protein [Oscillospiraceae bacterium]
MTKIFWDGGAVLAPVPPALVSCGTLENPNVLTIAWTGIINTKPPMTYISVRPSRYSYNIIKESGEFVINLTTSAMCKTADFCGVRTGSKVNKFEKCGITAVSAVKINAPIIEECPVSIECIVREIKPLGTHDMFISEIVGVDIEEKYIDSKGKLNLQQCGLAAYAHGEYFALGRKLGDFGFSVRKKKKNKNKLNRVNKD